MMMRTSRRMCQDRKCAPSTSEGGCSGVTVKVATGCTFSNLGPSLLSSPDEQEGFSAPPALNPVAPGHMVVVVADTPDKGP
jgi:hypothetical protein